MIFQSLNTAVSEPIFESSKRLFFFFVAAWASSIFRVGFSISRCHWACFRQFSPGRPHGGSCHRTPSPLALPRHVGFSTSFFFPSHDFFFFLFRPSLPSPSLCWAQTAQWAWPDSRRLGRLFPFQ